MTAATVAAEKKRGKETETYEIQGLLLFSDREPFFKRYSLVMDQLIMPTWHCIKFEEPIMTDTSPRKALPKETCRWLEEQIAARLSVPTNLVSVSVYGGVVLSRAEICTEESFEGVKRRLDSLENGEGIIVSNEYESQLVKRVGKERKAVYNDEFVVTFGSVYSGSILIERDPVGAKKLLQSKKRRRTYIDHIPLPLLKEISQTLKRTITESPAIVGPGYLDVRPEKTRRAALLSILTSSRLGELLFHGRNKNKLLEAIKPIIDKNKELIAKVRKVSGTEAKVLEWLKGK